MLHWVTSGRLSTSYSTLALKTLIDADANVNDVDKWGRTPLHWAAGKGCIEAVKLLLSAGTDSKMKDGEGKTAAEIARARGRHEIADLIEQWNHDLASE